MAPPPRAALPAALAVLLALVAAASGGAEIISKSRVDRCVLDSGAGARLACERKLVVDMAVPSGTSGGEATMVAQVPQAEDNDTVRDIQDPPVISVSKSAVYAVYALTYIRDVAYKPEEHAVKTRKCEPDAGADVVKSCERLRYENGTIIEHSEPVCCPCGPGRRVPSSCGNAFKTMAKGKANTAHCLRFPGEWFHVFGIGTRSIGFSIRVQVRKGSSVSEVVVGPENRTVVSSDNFLRVKIVGDFDGYTSIPSFESSYLVTPREGAGDGPPQVLGDKYSKWMIVERVRFVADKRECNKIGVGYEAFKYQPEFCSSPFWSCLNGQLWNLWDEDEERIKKNQKPEYVVQGRFQRINQHPNAGANTFSVGLTEDVHTNLLVEMRADDIKYNYQRSPGKVIRIDVAPFEALSQDGTANITTKNIGKLEASYSLTFHCLSGINDMEEQSFTMKPGEEIVRSFYLRSSTDQAATHRCIAILKASDSSELDRAEREVNTTATVIKNGTQIGHQKDSSRGFFETVKAFCLMLWERPNVQAFLTSAAISGTYASAVLAILWALHHKGIFDPMYDLFETAWRRRVHPRHNKRGHHWHIHHHGDHIHRHHEDDRHKSGHHHHHHRVLHRDGEAQPEATTMEGHRHTRHDHSLAVQQRGGRKHRHDKAVVTALQHREAELLLGWDDEEDETRQALAA
ncbi:hypothetical protein ACP70R_031149 [Stipagrostis hirtigluma subsp. patula]